MTYSEYLESDEWKRRRQEMLVKANCKCQLCGKKFNDGGHFNLHHNTYESLGHEPDYDLIVLCRRCHARFHGKNPYNRRGKNKEGEPATPTPKTLPVICNFCGAGMVLKGEGFNRHLLCSRHPKCMRRQSWTPETASRCGIPFA